MFTKRPYDNELCRAYSRADVLLTDVVKEYLARGYQILGEETSNATAGVLFYDEKGDIVYRIKCTVEDSATDDHHVAVVYIYKAESKHYDRVESKLWELVDKKVSE